MIRKHVTRLLALLVWMLISSALISMAEAQERETVKIGLIFPLTGPMSSFGEDIAKALPILEKKFNKEQSKYKFSLLLEDGQFGHSNAAITAAKKLIDIDGAKFLVVGSSGEILQIAPYAESSRVLSVAGFASHPDVKKAGDYIFRTYIDTERGIRLVADDILKKGFERVAVISEMSSFTSAIKDCLQKSLSDKVVFSEDYAFGEADFRTVITKARSKHPEVYFLNAATPTNFIALFKQLRENGVHEQFYAYYTPSLKDVQENLSGGLVGTIYLDYPDTTDTSQDFTAVLSEFESKVGGVVSLFNFRTNYNAIKVIFDGVMSAGPEPTRVKNFLYSYDQPSATGRLRFDSNGDVKDLNLVLRTYKLKSRNL